MDFSCRFYTKIIKKPPTKLRRLKIDRFLHLMDTEKATLVYKTPGNHRGYFVATNEHKGKFRLPELYFLFDGKPYLRLYHSETSEHVYLLK